MADTPYQFDDEIIELAGEYLIREENERSDFYGRNLKYFPELEQKTEFLMWTDLSQKVGSRRSGSPLADLANIKVDSPNDFADVDSFSERFQPEQVLGAGEGMFGQIVRCVELETGRKVAIKKIHGAPESALAEAKVVASLSNSYIVQIYQVIRVGEHILLVYEYLNGLSLAQRLKDNKSFSPDSTARLIQRIARGLGSAHAVKIVHSDIKPENIVLVGEIPKIVDFGLSYSVQGCDENLKTPRGGTPFYRSPEHEVGDPTGFQGDVFALGVVMYQLLTGEYPYTPVQVLNPQFSPTAVRKINSEVNRDLEAICMKCIAACPDERFADGTEVAEEIERYFGSEILHCRPKTPSLERINKGFRRNKTRVLIGAIVGLIALSLAYGVFAERSKYNTELAKVEAIEARRYEEEQRRIEAEEHLYETAMLNAQQSGQRGQWQSMLDSLDAASEVPNHDPIAVMFAKLTALDALERNAERDQTIKELLDFDQLDAEMKGAVLLWKADIAEMSGKCNEADSLIQLAKDTGLSEADRCYANAIQEETIPDSISQLEECIRLNRLDPSRPYHFRANAKLAVEYFLMSRRKEARQQCTEMMFAFPDDFQFPFFLGLIDVLDGDLKSAIGRVETNRFISKNKAKKTVKVYRILAEAVVEGEMPPIFASVQLIRGVLSLIGRSNSGISSTSLLQYASVLFGTPDTLTAKLELPRRMKALLIYTVQFSFTNNTQALSSIEKILPEPSIRFVNFCFRAQRHRPKHFARDMLAQLRDDAEKEYHISGIRTYSVDAVATLTFSRSTEFTKEARSELDRFLQQHSPTPRPFHCETIRGIHASHAGDHDLANFYFHQHLMRDPKFKLDGGNTAIWGAYSAFKVGDYCRALKMAKYSKIAPKRTPPMSRDEIKEQSLAKIRDILKKYDE